EPVLRVSMIGCPRHVSKCTKGLTGDEETFRAHGAVGFIRPVPNLEELWNPVIVDSLVGREVNPQTSVLQMNELPAPQCVGCVGKFLGKPLCKGLRRSLLAGS